MKSFKEYINESSIDPTRTPKFGDGQIQRAQKNANIIKDKIKDEYKSGKIDLPTLQHTTKKINEVLDVGKVFKDNDPHTYMMNHIKGLKSAMNATLEKGVKSLTPTMADHANKHLSDLYDKINDYATDYASHQGNAYNKHIEESFEPKADVKHFGWQKIPNEDDHRVNFMTSKRTPYQLRLHAKDPDEGHHLGFQTLGGTNQNSLARTGKHETREVVGSVLGLAINKAKEEPSINKVNYQGADDGLKRMYDIIAKSPSFHKTLANNGFKYSGKVGDLHTIEKV